MTIQLPSRLDGRVLGVFFAVACVWHLAFVYRHFEILRSAFLYTDWMINYAGGFVRRGLSGELLLTVSEVTGIPVSRVGIGFLGALTVSYFATLAVLLRNRLSPFEFALLASPPGLLFTLHEHNDAARKDLLVVWLTLVALACIARYRGSVERLTVAFGVCAVAAVCVALFWEGFVFFCGPFIAVFFLALCQAGAPARAWVCSLLVLAAIVAVPVVIMLSGPADSEMVAAMCARLGAYGPDWDCPDIGSAIGYLQVDTAHGAGDVLEKLETANYAWVYGPRLLATCVSLWLIVRRVRLTAGAGAGLPPMLRSPVLHVVLFALMSAPMYVIALDWGRWMYLCFTLSAFYCLIGRAVGFMEDAGSRDGEDTRRSWIVGGLLFASSLFWHVPVYTNPGWIGETAPQWIFDTLLNGVQP